MQSGQLMTPSDFLMLPVRGVLLESSCDLLLQSVDLQVAYEGECEEEMSGSGQGLGL